MVKKKSSKVDNDEVIVNNEEIEKEVQKEKKVKSEGDDEPKLYHYLIVLFVIVGLFFAVYFGFNLYSDNFGDNDVVLNNSDNKVLNKYQYKKGNVTYNFYFHNEVSDIRDSEMVIEPTKYNILNTREFLFTYMEYNGSDNGKVTVSSGLLMSFFKKVYGFTFNPDENIKLINSTDCSNSTASHKVIIFNPYSDKEGVYFNQSNGCINVLSKSPERIIFVGEKFLYEILNEDEI